MIWLHSKWYCLKCHCARLSTAIVISARLLGIQLVAPNMIWLHSKGYCLKCYYGGLSTANFICGSTPNEGSYQCDAPSLLVASSLIVAIL